MHGPCFGFYRERLLARNSRGPQCTHVHTQRAGGPLLHSPSVKTSKTFPLPLPASCPQLHHEGYQKLVLASRSGTQTHSEEKWSRDKTRKGQSYHTHAQACTCMHLCIHTTHMHRCAHARIYAYILPSHSYSDLWGLRGETLKAKSGLICWFTCGTSPPICSSLK